ncbi:hypothetical protein [Sneathiella sp.]|uniref:hypothetical protein n=1 Tax=Sneathiella sp. TaxID=1964365 RepID=UPI0026006D07|nr:hypothetical protein [Sneathiella sp.]
MAYGQIYARPLPPVERMGRMKELIREPDEAPYIGGLDALKAAKLLREAQTPTVYTPRSLSEAATQARLPVPERQEQQVPQQRQVITEEDERILTAQAGGRAAIPQQIENLASKGRHGDTMLMHVNPDELKGLSSLLGPTTTNPDTGLPEAFAWWLPLIGAAVGGVGAAATGHDWKKGMLMGGLAGLGGAFMMPGATAAGAIPGMATGTGTVLPGSMATIGASMPGATAINPAVLAGGIAGGAGTGAAALPAMGSLAPWQQMMLGGTSFQAPAVAGQALAPLAGQATQMQNILGAAKGLGPAADSIYTMGGKQIAPELLQQSGLASWQAQPLKSQPSFFKQGLNYLTGGEGDQAVKGGTDTDMLGGIKKGIKEWWEPKSKLEKGLHVAGAGAGLAALAQPRQQQIADLPVRKVSEFTFEEDDDKDPRIPKTFTQAELEEAVEAGPVPRFFAKEGGIVSLNIGGAPTGGGPGGRASTGHYGEVGPIGVNTYNPYTAHYTSTPDRRGEGGYEAPVVPPFEFPEVTPFRSNLATSNIQDRL